MEYSHEEIYIDRNSLTYAQIFLGFKDITYVGILQPPLLLRNKNTICWKKECKTCSF